MSGTKIFAGTTGLVRTRRLLSLIGNPQNHLRVIHIAGTSGKGSTAYLISQLLEHLGFKVGLYVKPHLVHIRERIQINNLPISETEFAQYFSEIVPAIEQVRQHPDAISWYETLVAFAFYVFRKKQVDYAVIETGLGGLLDPSNLSERPDKIAVITSIGYDHEKILGNTLSKITAQKAGIIQPHNTVLTLKQHPNIMRVITLQAATKQAKLIVLDPKSIIAKKSIKPDGSTFDFVYKDATITEIFLNMRGDFQIKNCLLALTTVYTLSQRDNFIFAPDKIKIALSQAVYGGRCEILQYHGHPVILDGAHNPQKIKELIKTVKSFQIGDDMDFLVAFMKYKNYRGMLRILAQHAKHLYLTDFQVEHQDFTHGYEAPHNLARFLDKIGYTAYTIIPNTEVTLKKLLDNNKRIFVITGSLYLISSVYQAIQRLGTGTTDMVLLSK